MPCAAGEFVDPVAGLAAEQAGEFAVLPLDQVDGKMAGAVGHPVGVIESRQSRQEPRRPDADLTGEPDKAACLLVTGAGGDHEHWIVERATSFSKASVMTPSLGLLHGQKVCN